MSNDPTPVDPAAPNQMTEPVDLKKLALEVMSGCVVGSWAVPSETIRHIFLALALMGEEARMKMAKDGVVHVYEHLNNATGNVNGYPSFLSFKRLNREQSEGLRKIIEAVKETLAAIEL